MLPGGRLVTGFGIPQSGRERGGDRWNIFGARGGTGRGF
jgi:hypothetical protein